MASFRRLTLPSALVRHTCYHVAHPTHRRSWENADAQCRRLKVLREHLAGVSSASRTLKKAEHLVGHASGDNGGDGENDPDGLEAGVRGLELGTRDPVVELLSRIVSLRRGEALLFAPGAVIHVDERPGAQPAEIRRLGQGFLKIRVRNRITADGGRSIMAS